MFCFLWFKYVNMRVSIYVAYLVDGSVTLWIFYFILKFNTQMCYCDRGQRKKSQKPEQLRFLLVDVSDEPEKIYAALEKMKCLPKVAHKLLFIDISVGIRLEKNLCSWSTYCDFIVRWRLKQNQIYIRMLTRIQ